MAKGVAKGDPIERPHGFVAFHVRTGWPEQVPPSTTVHVAGIPPLKVSFSKRVEDVVPTPRVAPVLFEPCAYVTARFRAIGVPHVTAESTVKRKWSGFDWAEAPTARSGHVAALSVMVTPAVEVLSTPLTFVRFTEPVFVRVTGSTTTSPGSMTPLPFPGPPDGHES
jgi:hypothetical protein